MMHVMYAVVLMNWKLKYGAWFSLECKRELKSCNCLFDSLIKGETEMHRSFS